MAHCGGSGAHLDGHVFLHISRRKDGQQGGDVDRAHTLADAADSDHPRAHARGRYAGIGVLS